MNVLDAVIHARLIGSMAEVCERAGIPRRFIERSAIEWCTASDLHYLSNFRTNGSPGTKVIGADAVDRCSALCGALIRNHIDARVRTLEQLMDDPVEASVLICPNFYLKATKGIPEWKTQRLYDLLVDRYRQDAPTVLWVEDLSGLKDYGQATANLLETYGVCS